MATPSREKMSQLIKLAISYGFNRIKCTYSTLPLPMTQLPMQDNIAAWAEILLVAARIGILRLSPTLI